MRKNDQLQMVQPMLRKKNKNVTGGKKTMKYKRRYKKTKKIYRRRKRY